MIGLKLIAQEVQHQREAWEFEHDVTEHGSDGLLAAAAIVLSGPGRLGDMTTEEIKDDSTVPWAIELWEKHRSNPKRLAMIAAALCVSAIDVMAFELGAVMLQEQETAP